MKHIYQFKITLKGSKPSIYRTIIVEDDRTFYEFHHIIQIVMGWFNCHLYQFNTGAYCITDSSMVDYKEVVDSEQIKLNQVFMAEGEKIEYEYDFGDGWIHTIKLEKIVPIKLNELYPTCIRGKRNCPPEDCGGIWGYEHLLEVIKNKKHPKYKDMKDWLEDDFDPEYINIEEINNKLKHFKKVLNYEND
jgi:hypothetical protein